MLKVNDLELTYRTDQGVVNAVRGISFAVERGQFFTLLGPSGCGKTSTLRSIAGLEMPDAGHIEIGSDIVYSSATRTVLPSYRRDIGMVFQSYAIWPHMTVFENVAFPLAHGIRKKPRRLIEDKVMWALSLVQLEELAHRPAPLLSGGQQQRVALARSLVTEPTVLLLDEPLSNLDAKLREDMRHELKSLVRRLETTTLYVTHDQLEALSMSDTVALMCDGEIVQSGRPRDVYLGPQSAFTANFLGRTNLIDGKVSRLGVSGGSGRVGTDWGDLLVRLPDWAVEGGNVTIGFRPESIILSGARPNETDNVLQGTVSASSYLGDTVEYQIGLGDHEIRVKGEPFAVFEEGDAVFVRIPPDRCYVLGSMSDTGADPYVAA